MLSFSIGMPRSKRGAAAPPGSSFANALLLEDGSRLLQEDGSIILLELQNNYLLQESGSRLLQEDGSFILLET